MKKILVVIPAYNEEKTIKGLIKEIPQKIEDYTTQVLVIDDGSKDRTAEKAREAGAIVYYHQKNEGLGAALKTGIQEALRLHPAAVVTIDADGQFDPQDIPRLVNPIIQGEAGFVTGSRFLNRNAIPGMPKIKFLGNKIVAKVVNLLTGSRFYDVSTGFRAYSYDAALRLNIFGKFNCSQEIFLDLCFKKVRIKEIPVDVKYFPDRKSKVASNLWRYGANIIAIIIRAYYGYNPLKFFCSIGSAILIFGLALGVAVFIYFLIYGTFAPYRGFGIIGLFVSGLGLLTILIGLIIDILGRMRSNQEEMLYYLKKKEYEE